MPAQDPNQAAADSTPDGFQVIGITPDAVVDGGDLDCGSGLLLIIRRAMNRLETGPVIRKGVDCRASKPAKGPPRGQEEGGGRA